MDLETPQPDIPNREASSPEKIGELSNAKLVGSLLDNLDQALDAYDADVESSKGMSDEDKENLLEVIGEIRNSMSIDQRDLDRAQIRIVPKTERPEDADRLDRGEDVGVHVEIELPTRRKLIVLNVWGSRVDYESTVQYNGNGHAATRAVVDKPRTINFHVYHTHGGGQHGNERTDRLLHDARYTFFRSGHPSNRTELMRFDGSPIPKDDRPLHVADGYVSSVINRSLFPITDELFTRRELH